MSGRGIILLLFFFKYDNSIWFYLKFAGLSDLGSGSPRQCRHGFHPAKLA